MVEARMGDDFCSRDTRFTGHFWGSFAASHATSLIGGDAAGSTSGTTVLKWRTFAGFLQAMRIELNYQADSLDDAICQAIVAYLGKGMPPREIIDQLIARGFVRDPGNNALEDVVQGLADMAEQMRRDRATLIG